MNAAKKKRLEAAGWKIGDASEFLGLSKDEAEIVEAQVRGAEAARREARGGKRRR